MEIRKLTTWQERFEGEHVIQTAFLHDWDEDAARTRAQAGAAPGEGDEAWGLFDDAGTLATCIATLRRTLAFGGEALPAGEVHMVGSLPEMRGVGGVRNLMRTVLEAFRERGDALAVLIPFSCSFYRKFGFEHVARSVQQRFAIDQLADFSCDYRVTEVRCEDDVAAVRALYDSFSLARNLAEVRSEAAWAWRGNGEFGEPDFLHPDRHRYTYVLWDENGRACAYVRFAYVCDPEFPFVGEALVEELVYNSPEAFKACLGFLYRLRAKISHVVLELLDDIDLTLILPESKDVEQKVQGHIMARILDVERVLSLMPHPAGARSYTLQLHDAFMPEHDGCYRVSFAEGAAKVERGTFAPDIELDQTTLCQLVVGRACFDDALLRPDVHVHANADTLRHVFVRRAVCVR